jgi:multidrug resistance efflux pump
MAALSVAHESACERRHFRVTTPAEVEIGGAWYPTVNWSLGGFKIDGIRESAQPGNQLRIHFRIDFQGFGITFDTRAEVVRMEGTSLAAKFIKLGERESELLRQFVAATLGGQMVPVAGVVRQINRPVANLPVANERQSAPRKSAVRRFVIASLYILVGLATAAYALLTVAGMVTRINIETAVTSAPLEQVVSTDVGTIRELYVQPGSDIRAGQPLFRVENEVVVHNVEAARQERKSAEVDLRQAHSATEQEERKLATYRVISNDQREISAAKVKSQSAQRDEAGKEFERAKKLWEYGVISRQLYESQAATLAKEEALVEEAISQQKIVAESYSQTSNGYFYSGNFLVGDLQTRIAEEAAARERLTLAQAALQDALSHESQRVYRAPFDAAVMRVFKSTGMTVDRGEALIVLRRTGEIAHVDAYLTQAEAGLLANGSRGVAFLPAQGKRFQVEVVSVDRTAGFLKDIQTPKLQQPQFTWRNVEDRSAYAKLNFVGVSGAELAAIGPGLPVQLSIPKKRESFSLLRSVHAAWSMDAATGRHLPLLWPAQSPLLRDRSVYIKDAGFEPVRRRVFEAAETALRKPPAPVESIHSAGVTDKTSPDFVASRRAFQDADNFALLALAYRLTGKNEYLEAARGLANEWARVNRPTGNPIDETRLEGFLWGIDLLGVDVETAAVTEWLGRWHSADRAWKSGPNTENNNHKTHHLKTLLMLDRLLGRSSDYERDLVETQHHLAINLAATDGSSIDYHERDALHYHVFDLEAWTEIALLTGCCQAKIDRAFGFFERTLLEHPDHVEFANSTAPIDRKRASAGFGYAQPKAYDPHDAAREIFSYATVSGHPTSSELWKVALNGTTHSNLFYEARYYLWQAGK